MLSVAHTIRILHVTSWIRRCIRLAKISNVSGPSNMSVLWGIQYQLLVNIQALYCPFNCLLQVQYSTSSKVVRPYHSQNTVTVTGTSLQIVDLQPFTQYTVSVTAVTAQGDSIAVQQPFTLKSPRLRKFRHWYPYSIELNQVNSNWLV